MDLDGAAALLANLLAKLLPEGTVKLGIGRESRAGWPRGFAVFADFASDKGQVWRLRDPLGFEVPAGSVTALTAAAGEGQPDTLVIDDAGLNFRHITAKPAWPQVLVDKSATPPNWLIMKCLAPIAAGDLWHHLMADLATCASHCAPVAVRIAPEQVQVTPTVLGANGLDLAGDLPTTRASPPCGVVVS